MHTCVVDRTTAETGCVGIVDIDKLLKYLKNISIFSKSISMKSQLGAGPSAGPRRSGGQQITNSIRDGDPSLKELSIDLGAEHS